MEILLIVSILISGIIKSVHHRQRRWLDECGRPEGDLSQPHG